MSLNNNKYYTKLSDFLILIYKKKEKRCTREILSKSTEKKPSVQGIPRYDTPVNLIHLDIEALKNNHLREMAYNVQLYLIKSYFLIILGQMLIS